MRLGPYVTYDGDEYECTLCQRYFGSQKALEDHCRNTSRHSWCERCERVFASQRAKAAHLRHSESHHVCFQCDHHPDFYFYVDLKSHLESVHHWCPPCNLYFDSSQELRAHDINRHDMCDVCGDYFQNENNLRMHKQRHAARALECYGCDRTFKSFSGMLIHLESGNCDSRTDIDDVTQHAFDCYQSKHYSIGYGDYFCPACSIEFTKLSSLFQHAEAVESCHGHLVFPGCLAKLKFFIRNRLRQ